MLIDEKYFTYPDTYVAGIEVQSDCRPARSAQKIISDLQAYAAKYEPLFLRMLLGADIAGTLKDYPGLLPLLVQPDKGTSVIAKYIYFYYSRDHMTFNTVAGEKLKNTENSTRTSPTHRLVRVWNDMVDECWHIVHSVENVELCPDFRAEIFEKINVFNI